MDYTSIDDLFYSWLVAANEEKDRLRLPPGFLEESVWLIQRLFGTQWMTNCVLATDQAQPILVPLKNPLRQYLRSSGVDRHISEIVELATYLRKFESDAKLNGKIARLKGESFWPTFFELAMAYRMRLAGFQLSLSAEDGSGLGDFIGSMRERSISVSAPVLNGPKE
jgi:hypothetical protein